ncbi:hypothetical protein OX90_11330 [Pseudomonas coronafaciens pv. porri]|uniref:SMODS and SLOG-associating 2TM effector domain-containing protein n=1 Tax=Pseudomonas coronafaciens pv. porri TaxID=83964 RepID=A0ABR5JPM7_9PSED|nr:hypothetical protein [Pseudomonas coronafaciens]KOP59467.1 hypothetical protein OX90_11330 [Pseudomonas coronafaciens pv. porri]
MKILSAAQIEEIKKENLEAFLVNEEKIYELLKGSPIIRISHKLSSTIMKVLSVSAVLSCIPLVANNLMMPSSLSASAIFVFLFSIEALVLNLIFQAFLNNYIVHKAITSDEKYSEVVDTAIAIEEFKYVLENTDGSQLGVFNYYYINRGAFHAQS